MTDKELIQALRDEDITDVRDMMDCMEAAADRLEFLLRECAELKLQIQKEICKRVDVEAENEHLREVAKKIPRWISVDERLPEPNKDVLVIAHGWKGKVLYIGQESLVHIDYANGKSKNQINRYKAWICPECGWFVGEQYTPTWAKATPHNQGKCNFCSRCGQRIDWQSVESGQAPQRENVCESG